MSDDAKSRPVKDLKALTEKEAEQVKGGFSPVDSKLPPRPLGAEPTSSIVKP